MKTVVTSILLCCSAGFSFGQSTLTQFTQNSSVKFYASNNGVFFHNPATQTGGYLVPKDSLVSSIYNMAFMIAGEDINGQLKGAIGNMDNSDFSYGPIGDIYTDTSYTNRYAYQLWEVYRSEIEYHMAHWMDQGYSIPPNIENWPGNGNVANGESLMLAPFFDMNADNFYQPQDGDYPIIRGDKALYTIFNDHKLHPSGLQPIKVEVHIMFYQFTEMLPSNLNNTVFMNTTVFNRGTQTLYDTYVGHYVDFDLGNFSDDFMATNVDRQLSYVINSDLNDEYNSGNPGFGEYPPALGVVALDGNMSSNVPSPAAFSTGSEIYNVLRGLKSDGSPVLDLSGNPTTYFLHELDSAVVVDSVSIYPPADQRALMGYEVGTLVPGGRICLNNAVVYARSEEGYLFASADSLFAVTDYIQDFFDQAMWACEYGGLNVEETVELSIVLFPNPAQNELSIEGIESGLFRIISLEGKIIKEGEINQSAIDVSNLRNGCYLVEVRSGNRFGVERFVKE